MVIVLQAKALFFHAVRMILRDPKAALRATALPYVLAQVLPVLLYDTAALAAPDMIKIKLSLRLAAELAFLAGMAWMAVAWHRLILIHETGWPLPTAPMGRVAAYLGYVAAFEVTIMLVSFIVIGGMAATVLFGAAELAMQVPVYLGIFAASVLFGRLGAILPAVALGPVTSILDGWRATRGATLTVALTCLVLFLLEEAVFRGGLALQTDSHLSDVLQAVLQWPIFLLGIALLTSTYLHYVKGQPLD
jgi:hypothetical protein